MTTTQSLRQKHVDRTRQAIIEAAFGLFREHGFGATTVEQIAERADVAPRTFFRYFPTKESVLFHDSDATVQTIRERMAARLETEAPAQSMVAVLRSMVEDLAGDPEKAQLICRLSEDEKGLLASRRRMMIDQFSAAIAEVVAERTGIPANDIELQAMAAAVVACGATAIQAWSDDGALDDPKPDLERALKACSEAFSA